MAEKKKDKYDRRRAIECKMERPSSSNLGYFKYNVTIREKNGNIHTEPAYGKDMQDALSRLINKERIVKVENKIEKNFLVVFLIWLALMGWPAVLTSEYDSPKFLLYAIGSITIFFGVVALWYNHVNKGE
tara:strand:+ start:363 stop:752 length:390 start_codon:yes stop_codon:yes gene_type:complete